MGRMKHLIIAIAVLRSRPLLACKPVDIRLYDVLLAFVMFCSIVLFSVFVLFVDRTIPRCDDLSVIGIFSLFNLKVTSALHLRF